MASVVEREQDTKVSPRPRCEAALLLRRQRPACERDADAPLGIGDTNVH